MLYLCRSDKGQLLLTNRKASHKKRISRYNHKHIEDSKKIFFHGQRFKIDEFNDSLVKVPITGIVPENFVPVELHIINHQKVNKEQLWVTRDARDRLMLHSTKPMRMKCHPRYEYDTKFRPQNRYIKKDATKWVSLHGYCYISEFPGSETIYFKDQFPTPVGVHFLHVAFMPLRKF